VGDGELNLSINKGTCRHIANVDEALVIEFLLLTTRDRYAAVERKNPEELQLLFSELRHCPPVQEAVERGL
jgi:hypothetical protein